MTLINTIDFVSVFFPQKTIAKIAGQPNFKTLKKLQKQIKANAASVTSSLGGGLHGHLGLLLIPASKYSNISGCQFIRLVHSGNFKIVLLTMLYAFVKGTMKN